MCCANLLTRMLCCPIGCVLNFLFLDGSKGIIIFIKIQTNFRIFFILWKNKVSNVEIYNRWRISVKPNEQNKACFGIAKAKRVLK